MSPVGDFLDTYIYICLQIYYANIQSTTPTEIVKRGTHGFVSRSTSLIMWTFVDGPILSRARAKLMIGKRKMAALIKRSHQDSEICHAFQCCKFFFQSRAAFAGCGILLGAVSHHVIEVLVHTFKRTQPTGPQMLSMRSILSSQLVRPHLNHIGDDVRILF